MTHPNSKYLSLSYTIIIISTMFFGIVLSIVYSKSFKHSLFKHSAKQSNDQTLKSNTLYYENSNIIKPYIAKFKLYESPIGSVPVQLKLGKITFVKNPIIPKFELLLSALDGIKFKNNNKWKQNINHHDWYLLD